MFESLACGSGAQRDCALVQPDVRLPDPAHGQHAAGGPLLRQVLATVAAEFMSVFVPRHRVVGPAILVDDGTLQLHVAVHSLRYRLLPRHCTHAHATRLLQHALQFYTYRLKGKESPVYAAYMSQTRGQKRFTISEVAADWHEPMLELDAHVL